MFDFFWNLAAFVIALGILVTVHEYGHFWVARKCGVHVHRFSVGFGKAIWRKTDKYGTEFVVALIPLGGYVKMLDERVEEVAPEDREKAFNHKSVYQRIAIIAAGPLANFLFAIFAFYVMFLIGIPSVKPIIGDVESGSISALAQLPPKAEIVKVADQSTENWQAVNLALVSQIGQSAIDITVKPENSERVIDYRLDTQNWQFSPEKMTSLQSLGIVPFTPPAHTVIAQIQKNSPADKASLIVGERIVSLNGQRINDQWPLFSSLIKEYPNQEVTLVVEKDGIELHKSVLVGSRVVNNSEIGYLGIVPKVDAWPENYRIDIHYGLLDSFWQANIRTWQLISFSFDMIGKLITGDISVKNLSGPIAIAQGAGTSAGYGIIAFLSFLALISINLGIINLLPLPVLDGGHLLYYFIELISGKPVPERIQEMGFKFGAIALLGLMSIALFNDISRL